MTKVPSVGFSIRLRVSTGLSVVCNSLSGVRTSSSWPFHRFNNTVREDQRKRTLEALQLPKLNLYNKTEKTNRLTDEDGEKAGLANCSTASSATNSGAMSVKTPPRKDAENDGPAYSKLSHHMHENLLTTNVQISGRKESKVDKIFLELLQNGIQLKSTCKEKSVSSMSP